MKDTEMRAFLDRLESDRAKMTEANAELYKRGERRGRQRAAFAAVTLATAMGFGVWGVLTLVSTFPDLVLMLTGVVVGAAAVGFAKNVR